MASNEYHFTTYWRLPATCQQVYEILGEADDLARWWPSVYLNVQTVTPGDAAGVGKIVRLYTKGWLPYTLRWNFTVTRAEKPYGFAIRADGDFVGTGVWTFTRDGDFVDVVYDWRINAEKRFLKLFSFIFKPIFRANHRWAMARGLDSLQLELQRRNAPDQASRDMLPLPPGPTSGLVFGGVMVAGMLALGGIAFLLLR